MRDHDQREAAPQILSEVKNQKGQKTRKNSGAKFRREDNLSGTLEDNVARDSMDPRVRHAGKAGGHHTRQQDVLAGRRRKPKHQTPRHQRWLEDTDDY